jgi:hypothetical protein
MIFIDDVTLRDEMNVVMDGIFISDIVFFWLGSNATYSMLSIVLTFLIIVIHQLAMKREP